MAQKLPPGLAALNQATLSPETVKAAGAGKAYQSVAQSGAIVVQDAADNLRNVMTISTTAIGVAMAKYIATQDPFYLKVITHAQNLVDTSASQFKTLGQDAAKVVSKFPVR
jgi:hypothetical protein